MSSFAYLTTRAPSLAPQSAAPAVNAADSRSSERILDLIGRPPMSRNSPGRTREGAAARRAKRSPAGRRGPAAAGAPCSFGSPGQKLQALFESVRLKRLFSTPVVVRVVGVEPVAATV